MQSILLMNKSSSQVDCYGRTLKKQIIWSPSAFLNVWERTKQLGKKGRYTLSSAVLVLPMKERIVDIRPELFEDEGASIDTDIKAPFSRGVPEGTLARWIVQVGNSGCGASANDFSDVEGRGSRIGPRDNSTAEGIASAFEKAALA
jgi:hypothetical protein